MIQAAWSVRWTIICGVLVGVMLGPWGISVWSFANSLYDQAYPVVKMSGQIISRDADSVLIKIAGQKLRDCRYVRLSAYGDDGDESTPTDDLYIRREDVPENGFTRPRGFYSIGTWRVWPVRSAIKLIDVYAQHDCQGRIVLTRISSVHL